MTKNSDFGINEVNDPTETTALRAFRDKTCSELVVRGLIEELKQKEIGLVLSGGGGKGAYEVGVILALHDCGITNYASIAGTSVGGLNAVLCQRFCQQGRREEILEIWGKMARSSVMSLTFRAIPKLVLTCLSWLILIPRIDEINYHIPVERAPHLAELETESESWLHSGLYVLAAGGILFGACLTFLFLFFLALPYIPSLNSSPLGFLLFYFSLFAGVPLLSRNLARKFPLFSNDPLKKIINRFDMERICKAKPPITCTLAERTYIYRHREKSPTIYTPHYYHLDELTNTAEAKDVLIQTSAIPDIFHTRVLHGKSYVDGGMADNTPILGLFRNPPPDTLFVVYLDHRYGRLKNVVDYEVRRLMWILSNSYGFEFHERTVVWNWFTKAKVYSFIPSQPLGGLVYGTFNFSEAKARWLIQLGYEDGLRNLCKIAGSSLAELPSIVKPQ